MRLTLRIVETVLIILGFLAELNGVRLIFDEVGSARRNRDRARSKLLMPPIASAMATAQHIVGNPASIPPSRLRAAQQAMVNKVKDAERAELREEQQRIDGSIIRNTAAIRSLVIAAACGCGAGLLAVWS